MLLPIGEPVGVVTVELSGFLLELCPGSSVLFQASLVMPDGLDLAGYGGIGLMGWPVVCEGDCVDDADVCSGGVFPRDFFLWVWQVDDEYDAVAAGFAGAGYGPSSGSFCVR